MEKSNMLRIRKLFLAVLLLLAVGCATTGNIPEGKEITMEATTTSMTPAPQSFDVFAEYRIAPGDELDVLFQMRTWLKKEDFRIAIDHTVSVKFVHAPELDTSQKVRPDGNITLPYIGDIYVVDKHVTELTKDLVTRYKDILQIPEISVNVPDFRASIKELKTDLHTAPRGLSRLATVRPDGHVTFPLLGDMFVAGRTIPEVNKEMNDQYEKVLPGLHCDLFLEKSAGGLIYVVGEVAKPGPYKLLKPVTVLEAISLAANTTPGANISSIIVIRKQEKNLIATRVNLKDTLSFTEGSKMFYLMPNDVVYVPKTWIKTAAEVARDVADVLLFNGWSVGFSWQLHDAGTDEKSNLDFK